ncbi:MAG: type II secretion system protein [Pyrinomonadaceae bacterium]
MRIDKLRSVVSDRVSAGFTLFELVVTLAVLSVLVVGTIPLTQNAIKRQKELRLRETLRQMRAAIDEFKRDTYGACPQGAIVTGNPIGRPGSANAPSDPRSRVVVDDCTIFDTENLDRFPPDINSLVDGVRVKPRGINMVSGRGLGGDDRNATDINANEEIIKVYLRELPVDPMTGESNWEFRSSYQDGDSSWDQINVFDVRSSSDEEGLNGEKYSDW